MLDIPKTITSLVDWLLKFRAEERAETKAAAASVRKAIVETELLFKSKQIGVEPHLDARANCARLWMDASTEFRTVDRTVSDGCYKISLEIVKSLEFTEEERTAFNEKFSDLIQTAVNRCMSLDGFDS